MLTNLLKCEHKTLQGVKSDKLALARRAQNVEMCARKFMFNPFRQGTCVQVPAESSKSKKQTTIPRNLFIA